MRASIAILSVIVVFLALYCASIERQEIRKFPDLGLTVIYRRMPFVAPTVSLEDGRGKRYECRKVGKLIRANDIRVFGGGRVSDVIIVLSGDADWVWKPPHKNK